MDSHRILYHHHHHFFKLIFLYVCLMMEDCMDEQECVCVCVCVNEIEMRQNIETIYIYRAWMM